MKKILLLAVPALILIAGACTKHYDEEIKTPAKNSWFLNDKTFTVPNMTLDTTNTLKGAAKGIGSITVKFSKKPTTDGTYTLRQKADEIEEIAITIVDSATKQVYQSMDDDGFQISKDQFAQITINGGSVHVSFTDVWLKNTKSVEQAKVSANLN